MKSKPRILICDDLQMWVRNTKDVLEDKYYVDAQNTVKDSIDTLEKDREQDLRNRYAVVIVDLDFKDLATGTSDSDAGFKILHAARVDPLLESVVYTAFGDQNAAFRAITEGAFGFVPKDDKKKNTADLLSTVDRAVALHERCLDLIDEIETLAKANPQISAIGSVRTHFIEYVRHVRGRAR